MADAFLLHEQEALTVKTTKFFIELFDALLTKMSQNSNEDVVEGVKALREHLFRKVLSPFVLQQKLALEVFSNYEKWNVVISDTGLVASVDLDVFVPFVASLKTIFSDLTNDGTRFMALDDLVVMHRLIDNLCSKFKANIVVATLKGAGNLTKHSLKFVARTTGKAVSAVGSRTVKAAKSITLQSVKRAVLMTGAASATALFLWTCYTYNHRKKLARGLFEAVGGMDEVKKKAVLLYVDPESKWKRLTGWLRDWIYDDADFRRSKADSLRANLEYLQVPAPAGQGDPLTQVLVEVAKRYRAVRQEDVGLVLKEMQQDASYQQYKAKKLKFELQRQQQAERDFSRASSAYLSTQGGWKLPSIRFSLNQVWPFSRNAPAQTQVYAGQPLQVQQAGHVHIPMGLLLEVPGHEEPTAPPYDEPEGIVTGIPVV